MKAVQKTKDVIRWLARLGDVRFWLWLSCAGFFLWLFMELSFNLFLDVKDAPKIIAIDDAILRFQLHLRSNWLNGPAVDVTSLGSPTILIGVIIGTFIFFWVKENRRAAWQLAVTAAGAACLSEIVKLLLEKPRPDVIPRLVEVTGYSYPSGHTVMAAAVYTMLAIIAARSQDRVSIQMLLFVFAGVATCAVSFSRIYLGVHYPSDVAAGISLGLTWAFLVAALFSHLEKKYERIL